jgi:AraC family transcriptional regulator
MDGRWHEGFDGGSRVCAPQTVIYHPAGEVHWDDFRTNGGRVFAIELGPEWLERMSETSRVLEEPRVFPAGMVPWAATRICDESRRSDSAAPLVIEGLMLELLGTVERVVRGRTAHGAPSWLAVVEQVLRDAYRAPPKLSQLAKLAGVHPVHLARAFRARHGMSPAEYVARVRVDHASTLIQTTRASLAAIAAQVGFCDQSHMTKEFRRIMGTTPARYRAAL